MAARDNAYSHAVYWLKFLLPLGAFTILAAIFFYTKIVDVAPSVGVATGDVLLIAVEPSMKNPHYAGVTRDGSALSIIAESAVSKAQSPGQTDATDVTGELTAPRSGTITLSSDTAHVDTPGNLVTFNGNVHVNTSHNYHATAPHLEAALDKSRVVATGGVMTTAPIGRITSETMRITVDPKAPGAYVLVFDGAVDLFFKPGG
jgi:lipopolysaccharide export system protein LptC